MSLHMMHVNLFIIIYLLTIQIQLVKVLQKYLKYTKFLLSNF